MNSEEKRERAVGHLQRAVRLETVSYRDKGETDFDQYGKFRALLREAYPLVHEKMTLTPVNVHSLVYRWEGAQRKELPTLFMAHYDVVPVEPGTEADWTHPAFSGARDGGRIWGRGTLDIKSQIIALMEAAESLLAEGFVPKNDIYFCFGHDEEVSGEEGAGEIVKYLSGKNLRFATVYDEGGAVVTGAIKGVKSPVAAIGVAEKGYCDVKITVEGKGGHSSSPPPNTTLGLLAKVMAELERRPMRARLTSPVLSLLKNIAPEMGFAVKTMVGGHRVFWPVLSKALASGEMTNAMIRTTMALTMAGAGNAANVLPQSSWAIINARLLPGDSGAELLAHIRRTTDKYGAKAEITDLIEASSISPDTSPGYLALKEAVAKFFPDAIITPYMVMGGTDSSKYQSLCDNIYRFTPYQITAEEQATMHNTDESIREESFLKMAEVFSHMMKGL